MDNALSTWLQLREPADAAARSVELASAMAAALPTDEPVRVLDLACGTGSNLRYLAPRLPPRQRWLVVDRDRVVLDRLPALTSAWGAASGYDVGVDSTGCLIRRDPFECHVEARCLDLGLLDDAGIFAGRHLVTASALLDLVSDDWLSALAARCRAEGAAVLFAITYDGRSSCSPADPEDAMILELFNRHQKIDKGLGGPAAGPDGAASAARAFAGAGYRIRVEPSEWVLGPAGHAIQRTLIDGWAEAATEIAPADGPTVARWHARRIGHVDAGRSRLIVGHVDMAAWLS